MNRLTQTVFALLLGAAALPAAAQNLVPSGAAWKYEATGSNLGTAWRGLGYNDAAWPSGNAILGYGEPYITTVVPYGPDPNAKYITTYFRHGFTRGAGDPTPTSMILRANYDDGFVAYLNGVEIARRSLPGGAITYTTTASSHEGGSFETLDVSAAIGHLVTGTNVLAVEVHQVGGSSSDLVMDMELSVGTGSVRVTRGPYLQRMTPTSVVVRWRTDLPTSSRVLYGASPGNLTQTVSSAATTTEHELALDGLAPDSWYTYAIGTADTVLAGDDADHEFHTPPVAGTPQATRIWILGDSGTGDANAAAVRNGYTAYAGITETDLMLLLGDNAYNTGTDAEYQAGVFDMYPTYLRRVPVWPTRGNHDAVRSGANNDYYDFFTLPDSAQAGGLVSGTEAYYSFDVANIHFICLDSQGTDRSPASPMWTWLTADAQATMQDWVIAFWHHPPYTKGSHDSDDPGDSGGQMEDMREEALPLLEAAGVDLVYTGHSHSYERSILINGHYGVSSTFDSTMVVDGGDGRPSGDGPYVKPSGNPGANQGTVYTVAGSSGKTGGGPLNHAVMEFSANTLGSVVLDVEDNQLDAVFIGTTGQVLDQFTVWKGTPGGVEPDPGLGPRLTLAANPVSARAEFAFSLTEPGPARLSILDVRGAEVATVVSGRFTPGTHPATWDTRNRNGQPVAPGVYFAVLETATERRTRKLTVTR